VHTIYVAGPVLRPEPADSSRELAVLYRHLAEAAQAARVDVVLPIHDERLDALPPLEFAQAIWTLIKKADAVVALLDAPGARPGTNLAVAGEAHLARVAGKRVAIVAEEPSHMPRLLRAVASSGVYRAYDVNFRALFRAMAVCTARDGLSSCPRDTETTCRYQRARWSANPGRWTKRRPLPEAWQQGGQTH
jgi:hypothetical protein